MAVIIYANGLTEDFLPKDHVFTDQEILSIFEGFDRLQSQRLIEVPNTWCIWGVFDNPKADDYNKLGSDILQYHCYSHILFVHDTEINLEWGLTDEIIQFGYADFKKELIPFIDEVALDSLEEIERTRTANGNPNLIAIEQVGVSSDKRIVFNFDPDKQNSDFFENKNFWEFAQKNYEFLKTNYKDGESFAIFADKKMILILADEKVPKYIEKLVKAFEQKEKYEEIIEINKIYKSWQEFKTKSSDKADRKKRSKKKE